MTSHDAWARVRQLNAEVPTLDAAYAAGRATVQDIRRQEAMIASAIRRAHRAEDSERTGYEPDYDDNGPRTGA